MSILSLEFLLFVLVMLAVYYVFAYLGAPRILQNLVLLAASYYFYWIYFRWYPYLLFAITLADYFIAHWLHKSAKNKRAILWLGILFNIGMMAWFLIGGKALQGMIDFTKVDPLDIMPLLVLPIGMSYYALNGISYLLDINLRLSKPTNNFVDFALYLAWFPKLLNGPLERARKFLPMLAEKRTVDNETVARSLTLILIGLFRTAILGGALTLLRPALPLGDPGKHGALVLLWALLSYMIYLYNQFAGYTDIVRGVSGLFGIELTRNFNSPFFAKDFSDFWTRWHISLSQWLRDYIYMPVSRAFLRKNPSRTNIPNLIVPPLATMLASGLWHSADLNHLVWGLLMGAFIVIENVRMLFRPAQAQAAIPLWRRIADKVWLVALMGAATVPFVMDLTQSRVFFRQIIKNWDGQMFDLRVAPLLLLSLLVDWIQFRHNDELTFRKWPFWVRIILLAVIPLAMIVIDQLQSAPPMFVYPQPQNAK